jgi:TorA maturation chaperone TorD
MPTPGERLRLAAGLLAAPGDESLPTLSDLAGGRPWLHEAWRELAALPLDAWRAEHGRLFINGFPRTPCLPFESAQVDGMMPGPSTTAVAALYGELGLAADDIAPDYLGAMLECAAYLTESTEKQTAEQVLWREHLLRWLPRYAATLQEESYLILYRGLGRELAQFCADHA